MSTPLHAPLAAPLTGRVLLIDDDEKLSRLLLEYLRGQGLEVSSVHDGLRGLERATHESWDLILLDVMLPMIDGFEVLRRLRRSSNVPVMMLTARGQEPDRIQGLDGGADDYLPKTASSRELLARIRALLRRSSMNSATSGSTHFIDNGELKIDLDQHQAILGDKALQLTPVEFDLLVALARCKGKVRSREQLLDEVRDREYEVFDRSIDVHVAALRRKLADDPRTPRFIRTVRTVGYLMNDLSCS
jgi:DNA-binding response OmpR family regulator